MHLMVLSVINSNKRGLRLKNSRSDRKGNLIQLISHRAHRVLREKSKKLCVPSGLCEIFSCSFL